MAKFTNFHVITTLLLLLLCFTSQIYGKEDSGDLGKCGKKLHGGCHDKAKAFKSKLIAIFSILVSSIIGVCLPLFTQAIPALQPDKNLFVIVKALASGVILATGYMHVLPDSFQDLWSICLPERPWRKFPFTTFVAMLSALVTLMIDSFSMACYRKKNDEIKGILFNGAVKDVKSKNIGVHHHHGDVVEGFKDAESQLLRNRVVAQVLESGIVVHSVVIGLSMGASDNACIIRPLIAALCFHQLFEGMGLGGCILQAEYGLKIKAIMVFFFSATTPFGIVLGIGLSNVYSDDSPTALIVVGLLNASSAGLLNYMALVDLLAADFMGAKLQSSYQLQIWSYVAVLLGAGGMSLMAKWA
ncbi:Zip domain-containing protein [Cephalotus follicularis]|uniref:Zip domain-containing protein n=1 Tax=Cephalotus follicularis TaxID=3775 RepID=A0A1Q3B8I4_CEPFO|nr:Zip domain-containing protein [Cephalotus follicularis]